MASPIHYEKHADPHFNLTTWLGTYSAVTPGVRGGDNATVLVVLQEGLQSTAHTDFAQQLQAKLGIS